MIPSRVAGRSEASTHELRRRRFPASQTDGESYIDTRTADSDSATIINAAALAFLMAFAVIVLAGEDTSELNDPRLQAEGF